MRLFEHPLRLHHKRTGSINCINPITTNYTLYTNWCFLNPKKKPYKSPLLVAGKIMASIKSPHYFLRTFPYIISTPPSSKRNRHRVHVEWDAGTRPSTSLQVPIISNSNNSRNYTLLVGSLLAYHIFSLWQLNPTGGQLPLVMLEYAPRWVITGLGLRWGWMAHVTSTFFFEAGTW